MSKHRQQIAVIGAGLAGLTIAHRLNQKGHNVHVYEARPRVGGRVQTVLIKNLEGEYSFAELGAQNIADGGEAKHLKSLVKEFNLALLEDETEFNSKFYDGYTFHIERELISQIQLSKEKLSELIQAAAQTSQQLQEVLNALPLSPLVKRLVSFWLRAYEGLPLSLLSPSPHNLSTLLAILQGRLSAVHEITRDNPSFSRINLSEGMTQLTTALAHKLQGRIHLQKQLDSVNTQDNNIVLGFSDQTVLFVEKLILAIPASVYSGIHFEPSVLPKSVSKSIQAMHYSHSSKIVLPIKTATLGTTSVCCDNFGSFYGLDRKLLNLYYLDGRKATLLNPDIYSQSLSILKGGYSTSQLSDNLPIQAEDKNGKKYDYPIAKSWLDDPFAKGAYSAIDITLTGKINPISYRHINVKSLFAPINERVFFVGEHTTLLDEIGTMEAAVESGERIAQLF